MPNFKPKNSKKLQNNEKLNETLDSKHKEFLDEFYNDENVIIPKYLLDKKNLEAQLKNEKNIVKRLELTESINIIQKNTNKLRLKKKNYFLNNSEYIFTYFENKKQIADNQNHDYDQNLNQHSNNNQNYNQNSAKENVKSLDTFFNRDNKNINTEIELNNIEKYFRNINKEKFNMANFCQQTSICNYCHKGEMIPVEHEGILLCNNCSKSIRFLIENEKPSYKEPPKEVCFYAYKRINHFREILAQFQAKETTQIPVEVLENIKLQIKKERIQLEEITNKKAKDILKKLGYNKYYEHIPFIKDKLGIKPPIMSPELEETLYNLFIELQSPYSKYCPDDRVNFLNYYYTAYKLCELLGEEKYLPLFPLLKDREKRIEQDYIWKKICEELDWEFIPTI